MKLRRYIRKKSKKQKERGIDRSLSCQVNRYRTIHRQGGGSSRTWQKLQILQIQDSGQSSLKLPAGNSGSRDGKVADCGRQRVQGVMGQSRNKNFKTKY